MHEVIKECLGPQDAMPETGYLDTGDAVEPVPAASGANVSVPLRSGLRRGLKGIRRHYSSAIRVPSGLAVPDARLARCWARRGTDRPPVGPRALLARRQLSEITSLDVDDRYRHRRAVTTIGWAPTDVSAVT